MPRLVFPKKQSSRAWKSTLSGVCASSNSRLVTMSPPCSGRFTPGTKNFLSNKRQPVNKRRCCIRKRKHAWRSCNMDSACRPPLNQRKPGLRTSLTSRRLTTANWSPPSDRARSKPLSLGTSSTLRIFRSETNNLLSMLSSSLKLFVESRCRIVRTLLVEATQPPQLSWQQELKRLLPPKLPPKRILIRRIHLTRVAILTKAPLLRAGIRPAQAKVVETRITERENQMLHPKAIPTIHLTAEAVVVVVADQMAIRRLIQSIRLVNRMRLSWRRERRKPRLSRSLSYLTRSSSKHGRIRFATRSPPRAVGTDRLSRGSFVSKILRFPSRTWLNQKSLNRLMRNSQPPSERSPREPWVVKSRGCPTKTRESAAV